MIADGQTFCAVKEPIVAPGTLCRWPAGEEVTYAFESYLAALGRDAQLRLTALAAGQFMRVCGVRISKVADPSDANVVIGAARRGQDNQFDGPSGVLAYCGLPCGRVEQVPLKFDLDENWTATDPNLTATVEGIRTAVAGDGDATVAQVVAGIQYFWVTLHEMGHGMGLPHAPNGVDAVMAPFYSANRTGWGAWDVQQLQARYGPPTAPPPTPAGVDLAAMRVLVGTERYRLVKE